MSDMTFEIRYASAYDPASKPDKVVKVPDQHLIEALNRAAARFGRKDPPELIAQREAALRAWHEADRKRQEEARRAPKKQQPKDEPRQVFDDD
jgi:hypothetical protein